MNHNPYALITGASSGIGYEYARIIAELGYNLVIVSNEDVALHEKAATLREQYAVEVVPVVLDLSAQESAKVVFDTCKNQNLEVEILVNNAGVYHDCDFLEESLAFNQLILNLHVYTPTMLIYYFGQDMVQRHKGFILNMSSITGDIAVQRLAAYGATKRYLRNFSRSLHAELCDKGVVVTTVCPGAVATNLYHIGEKNTKIGLSLGYIITPQRLAQKGVKAMLRGKSRITPGIINHVGLFFIRLIPIGLLCRIRKRKIY